jgi:hypothetical protein
VNPDPFTALGLPARPDLDDEQVRAAWRAIAAATHPDRPGGGNPARYAAASAAYAQLRTPWGRSEAWADLADAQHDTAPLPVITPDRAAGRPPVTIRPLRLLPSRIRHGRPLRLALRAIIAAALSMIVLALIPGQPAAPALVAGLVLWFALTGRSDLAPPPRR